MLKLFSLKDQQKKDKEAEEAGGEAPKKKQTPGMLRIQKDVSELDIDDKTVKIIFDDKNDLTKFRLMISPDEGYYKGGKFEITCKIPDMYPHEAPKLHCETKCYHPNIDYDGNICLNILREDWKPILNINAVIFGLVYLFLEPNHSDPLNKEAAQVLRDNTSKFADNVYRSMRGGNVANQYFDRNPGLR